ncbi:MAG: tRNA (adenosine(37)-N6)-threonylcarbamoyltransferase complex ATPase subunit type 1 TsaE [Candidatus Dormibacteraeota bacterium]|nr:tRNA (adenosine(37)-N6)-threonylcarbamoyltransferase complex ATPase subunit type 1 TsaE [Candidatus Dormibacteraeota bacterium]
MSTFVETHSAAETRALGVRLAAAVEPGDVIALEGELGSGKTELVKGLADGLGVIGSVHSPTFVLHHHYPGRIPLEHYDLYRLEGMSWIDAGLDEPAGDAVAVIEWPARAAPLESWATIQIDLAVTGEDERRLELRRGPDRVARIFNATRD